MGKIAIITITDNTNYGNRLQNYAVEKILERHGYKAETLWEKDNCKKKIKDFAKSLLPLKKKWIRYKRIKNFTRKNTNVRIISSYNNLSKYCDEYDYFVVGSDQIWNLKWQLNRNKHLLDIPSHKIISFSASFGIATIPDEYYEWYYKIISHINHISVREYSGEKIINETLKIDKQVEVLVDPTMLLSIKELESLAKKPKDFNRKKYILTYFLGDLSESRKREIERVAKENNCEIINIMDKKDKYYVCDPSEFLYLEKNAFLICTDSFHSSVFGFLYNRPFVIFNREEKELDNMNSRIDTLLHKFKLCDRKFNGKNITKANLNHDYKKAFEILELEKIKANEFLNKAFK